MTNSLKHIFPGGNTSRGFYSFFRFILSQEEANRIICLKGGPGTGKSTLMKKVGTYFFDKGYNVEFYHCSSDNDSLDGVVIKELKVAIIDGTAPHVVDPVTPGAIDEIVNLGQCWNEQGMVENRKAIATLSKDISKCFKRTYRYFGSAKNILDEWSTFNSEALSYSKINLLKEELKNEILSDKAITTLGYDKHLFSTAFTPNGIINYTDSLLGDIDYIYVLNGGPSLGQTDILKYLGDEALRRGFNVEFYHDPFIPERIENVFIPQLKVAILCSNEINQRFFPGTQIYMEDFCNKELLAKYNVEIEETRELFYALLNKGLSFLSKAKALHDDMEKYYIGNIDFQGIDKLTNDLIKKFEDYIPQ